MTWHLSGQGDTLAGLREIAKDDPEAAALVSALEEDMPVINPAFDWIWRAWHRLSDDRPRYGGGMGPSVPGRIPWTVVAQWCRHHDLTRAEMLLLDACFAVMDVVYLEWWSAAQAKPEK